MKHLHHTIRIITGLLFVAIFFSKFGILPTAVDSPHMFTAEGFAFIQAISANGYLFPTVGIISLLCGLAFLSNRYVALAAVILMPITVNFVLFHIFLGFSVQSIFSFLFIRESVAFLFFALNFYMLYSERAKYAALLKP